MTLKNCCFCKNQAQYKCPSCNLPYCSSRCFKNHKTNCIPIKSTESNPNIIDQSVISRIGNISDHVVDLEKLESLRDSDELKSILYNPHLRNLLKTINEAEDAEAIMQKAMQEPLFVEFADACLKCVDPPDKEL